MNIMVKVFDASVVAVNNKLEVKNPGEVTVTVLGKRVSSNETVDVYDLARRNGRKFALALQNGSIERV